MALAIIKAILDRRIRMFDFLEISLLTDRPRGTHFFDQSALRLRLGTAIFATRNKIS